MSIMDDHDGHRQSWLLYVVRKSELNFRKPDAANAVYEERVLPSLRKPIIFVRNYDATFPGLPKHI